MYTEDDLTIYTDGSSYPNPRKGGIGIRFVTINESGHEEVNDISSPGYKGATNNQMELYACIVALIEAQKQYDLSEFNKITLLSDSKYVVENHTYAIFNWPKNKWRNLEGRPIENADLWKKLVNEIKKIRIPVKFKWVKGHSKSRHNKAVDNLAKQSAKNAINDPLHIVSVRRKTSKQSVSIGSVEMKGQSLYIRIITTQYMPLQQLYKYKYEVLSEESKYYGNIDIIYSEESIRDGHCYFVTVNENTKNPRIKSVLKEIDCKTGETIEEY